MNLRDCKTLNDLEAFRNLTIVYLVNNKGEVYYYKFDMDSLRIIPTTPISVCLVTWWGSKYDVFTTKEEANKFSASAKKKALKKKQTQLIKEKKILDQKIKQIEEELSK